jgi:hypothetical protein
MAGLRSRVDALEKSEKLEISFADRLDAARRHWLRLTPEDRAARRIAVMREALSIPEPDRPLEAALWRARRRLARHYGVSE